MAAVCRKVYLICSWRLVGAGQSEPLWTFTIVTTAASSSFAWLHDRQPVILTSQDALDRWLDTSTQTWDPKLGRLLDPYNDPDTPLEWCAPSPPIQFSALSLTFALIRMYICVRGRWAGLAWLANSYAVPKEVGKVGVQSSTFIEPVQKRKDGIEAMFSRQAKAAQQQQKSVSRDSPPGATAAAAGSGKRKRESSSHTEEKEEEEKKKTVTQVSTTTTSFSPAKRFKVKKDPIKHDDKVDSEEEEGDSDVEILASGPSPVGQPTLLHRLSRA